jgi:serine/threonine-protein kinase
MELLDGCTLREALARDRRLEPARAARALGGVANAVGAAHERGLLHRDLKPENIFLISAGSGEVAKVFDFGIVKRLTGADQTQTSSSDTAPGLLVGTRRYMAPEQLAGGPPRTSWDLWALAVVAYETVTGVHPFREAGGLPAWPLPEADLHGAPSSLRAFFSNALAPDPARRPSSAAAFDAALQTALTFDG